MKKVLYKHKKAFTLVEFIIAVTIIAILFTIAFLSFKNYVRDARDGTRVSSIGNIQSGLEIENTVTGKYPDPDKKDGQTLLQTGALSISGSIIEYSYLGVVGDSVTRQLSLTKVPQDPLTGDKYIYTKTTDGRKYQIASILENPTSYKNNLVKQANAGNDGYVAKVEGNHKDIVIQQTSSGKYITVVPSLVFDPSGSNILNQTGTLSIINNKGNLPYSPSKSSSVGNTTTAEQLIREVRNNDLATVATLKLPDGVTLDGSGVLNQWWIPNVGNTNWNLYSSGVILASLGSVGVDGSVDYTKLTAILNGWSIPETTTTQVTTAVTPSYNVGNSLRFNGSNQYLSRTFSSGGNQKVWTFSTWIKRSNLGTYQRIINVRNSNWVVAGLIFNTDDSISFFDYLTTQKAEKRTKSLFRDTSAWYHILLVFDSSIGSVKLFVNGIEITDFSINVNPPSNYDGLINSNSSVLEIGRDNLLTEYFGGYLSDINFIDSGALDPTSFGQFDSNGRWVPKAYTGTYGTNGFHLDFSNGANLGADSSGNNNNWNLNNIYGYQTPVGNSSQVVSSAQTSISPSFKLSPGATINKVGSYSSSAGNGLKFKVLKKNSPGNYTVLSDLGTFNHSGGNTWQRWNLTTLYTLPTTAGDYYLAIYFPAGVVGGSFGYSSSVMPVAFMPGEATGTVTLNEYDTGYYTPIIGVGYSDNSVLAYDQMLDSPTNNFADWNYLDKSSVATTSDGNLKVTTTSNGEYGIRGNTFVSTGKWYFEVTNVTTNNWFSVGIDTNEKSMAGQYYNRQYGYSYISHSGYKGYNSTASTYGDTYTSTNVIGVAFDLNNGAIWFSKNGTWQASATTLEISNGDLTHAAFTGLSNSFTPSFSADTSAGVAVAVLNAGQGGQIGLQYCADAGGYFKYCPPTGFKALSTKNITYPIENPKQYFDVLTYTGNGTSQSLTGLAFQPDFMWFKSRTDYGGNSGHALLDSIRGITKFLKTHSTDQENTDNGIVTSVKTNGYDLGTSSFSNADGRSYVAWNWKKSSIGGFDIVNYTGNSTAGRSLPVSLGGKSPDFAIIKRTNAISDWAVYHKNITAGRVLWLQSTVGINDPGTQDSSYNNQIQTTNDTLILGATQSVNNSAGNYIAYVWSETPGYSKFGSYTGNGSTDGPFIYTGFKPRYIIVKRTDTSNHWVIFDNERGKYNPIQVWLEANTSSYENNNNGSDIDILSNGFKIRNTALTMNNSGGTYIYAAFAELPFK